MHPRNKYAEKPPDFNLLSSLYPAFKEYVSYGPNQKARIDWTNFNATRELTRSLLHHDYGITWWIPDGQLCPTVTNRANYIHWIEDLLALSPAPWHHPSSKQVAGIDIGTGANCIYLLLGTALHGWRFVGTDITAVALEWAQKNMESNPHVAAWIEIRCALADTDKSVGGAQGIDDSGPISIGPALPPGAIKGPEDLDEQQQEAAVEESHTSPILGEKSGTEFVHIGPQGPPQLPSADLEKSTTTTLSPEQVPPDPAVQSELCSSVHNSDEGEPCVLVGVVQEGETFDFCMCNPPFFESMEEAGLNPRTACGGTPAEMVCPGGEEAFVNQIIEDSVQLQHSIHWYTTMVGRKVTLKGLTAKLWALGAATVRTTEFVQGRTSRWGLAWSFTPPPKAAQIKTPFTSKSNVSFMLEGLGRGCSAVDVLQLLASQLQLFGASCSISLPDFSINGYLPGSLKDSKLSDGVGNKRKRDSTGVEYGSMNSNRIDPSFRASVFQQAPGSLLVKASLTKGADPGATFAALFEQVEQSLKQNLASRLQK